MKLLVILIPFIFALYLGRIITPFIYLVSYKKRLFDPINVRKLHEQIIPRLGGVAFAPIQCCIMTLIIVIFHKYNTLNDLHLDGGKILPMFLMLTTGLVILFNVGIADDLIGVSYKFKFVAQLIAATLLPLSGLWINEMHGLLFITHLPAWIGMPLTVILVMFIINAVNMIDGIDGLCSGLVLVGSLTLGVMFAMQAAWLHAVFAFVTTGMLIPFFYFNVFGGFKRKRRIFMGDTGSLTLGYSIAFLTISYAMSNPEIKPISESAIVPAFTALIVPLLDVVQVMWVRFRNDKSLFLPDRGHIHHRFLDLGLTHRASMVYIISLATLFIVFNVLMAQVISNNMVLLLDLVLWGVLNFRLKWIKSKSICPEALAHHSQTELEF